MSEGPEIETCMSPESPGPKSSTVIVEPRVTMAPVFEAEPDEVVVTPSTWAFGGVLEAGAGTTMSTPEADWPAAMVITIGGLTGLVLGMGGPVGFPDEDFPPQPPTARTARSKTE